MALIDQLLKATVSNGGSDLHLSVGMPPLIRKYGDLVPFKHEVITEKAIADMCRSVMTDRMMKTFQENLQLDFAYEIDGVGRFRGNAYMQTRGTSMAFRAIPQKIRNLETLGLSPGVIEQFSKRSGLILVTGPTGSGKSTTLAAIVDYINHRQKGHIITVEDPVEFIHECDKCLIHQRQIGTHATSFAAALKSALREDPDVILVGEMRDFETIELALTAAETGHLVLATLHTRNASKTLDRIIAVFPSEQQNQIRNMAAESIRAVISQVLLPRDDKNGMISAYEILISTSGIKNMIRENKIYQIPSAIQTGSRLGMRSMEQSIRKLLLDKVITREVAGEVIKMPEADKSRPASTERATPVKPSVKEKRHNDSSFMGGFKLKRR